MSAERDYIAEMDERIAAATAGSGWVAAVVAQKLHASLLESDPDLLDGWLHATAVQMLRRVIGLKGSQERSAAKRGARLRAFGAAASDFEAAAGGEERDEAAAVLLGMFSEAHVIDEDGTRKRAADMTGPEHLFVAETTYRKSANRALMLAAFHQAVAKKVGKRRTSEVFSEQEYEALYLSITKGAA